MNASDAHPPPPLHNPAGADRAAYERWCGDMVEIGKGELLIRQAV